MGILLFRMSGVLVEWSPGGGSDDGCKGIGEERPQLTVLEREPGSDWTGSDYYVAGFISRRLYSWLALLSSALGGPTRIPNAKRTRTAAPSPHTTGPLPTRFAQYAV